MNLQVLLGKINIKKIKHILELNVFWEPLYFQSGIL